MFSKIDSVVNLITQERTKGRITVTSRSSSTLTLVEIEEQVVGKIHQTLGKIIVTDRAAPFFSFGIDSLQGSRMVEEIGKYLLNHAAFVFA